MGVMEKQKELVNKVTNAELTSEQVKMLKASFIKLLNAQNKAKIKP